MSSLQIKGFGDLKIQTANTNMQNVGGKKSLIHNQLVSQGCGTGLQSQNWREKTRGSRGQSQL